MKFRAVEIVFPLPVEISDHVQQQMVEICSKICAAFEAQNPGRVMWPFGIGCKPTFIPMTLEEEAARGIEFDESTFQIAVGERADYAWPCGKCGIEQGEHRDHIINPKAGDCEFEPAIKGPSQ